MTPFAELGALLVGVHEERWEEVSRCSLSAAVLSAVVAELLQRSAPTHRALAAAEIVVEPQRSSWIRTDRRGAAEIVVEL